MQRLTCPTTTRIGDIDIAGRPCLLSKSKDPDRKTRYTVEAISLNRPEDNEKARTGINENAANRYLDFKVDNTCLEVKTSLINLQGGSIRDGGCQCHKGCRNLACEFQDNSCGSDSGKVFPTRPLKKKLYSDLSA